MIRLPLRNRPEWDALESRLCPSGLVVSSVVPVERTDGYAVARHDADLQQVASGADNVVFLGDSITDWWANGAGSSVWSQRMAGLNAADFGVAGDLAENLLWRIENGELAGAPRAAVVEIGTNNLGQGESVASTDEAVEAVVSEIHALSPSTQILLMGIFPRGASSTDPLRLDAEQVNAQLAAWAPAQGVAFLDIGSELTSPDGSLTADFLPGDLHPNASGYDIWADAVQGIVLEMLGVPSPSTDMTPTTAASTPSKPPTAPASASTSTPSAAPAKSARPASANVDGPPDDLTTGVVAPTSTTPADDTSSVTPAEVADTPVILLRVAQPTSSQHVDPFADLYDEDAAELS